VAEVVAIRETSALVPFIDFCPEGVRGPLAPPEGVPSGQLSLWYRFVNLTSKLAGEARDEEAGRRPKPAWREEGWTGLTINGVTASKAPPIPSMTRSHPSRRRRWL
jgi:hypothetical protein